MQSYCVGISVLAWACMLRSSLFLRFFVCLRPPRAACFLPFFFFSAFLFSSSLEERLARAERRIDELTELLNVRVTQKGTAAAARASPFAPSEAVREASSRSRPSAPWRKRGGPMQQWGALLS